MCETRDARGEKTVAHNPKLSVVSCQLSVPASALPLINVIFVVLVRDH